MRPSYRFDDTEPRQGLARAAFGFAANKPRILSVRTPLPKAHAPPPAEAVFASNGSVTRAENLGLPDVSLSEAARHVTQHL
jgi:hypothetical protein